MAAKRLLEDMVKDMGYPQKVAEAVLADAEKHDTRSLIEGGRSVLPTVKNAVNWYERQQRAAGAMPLAQAHPDTVQALQDRIAALETRLQEQAAPPEHTPTTMEG